MEEMYGLASSTAADYSDNALMTPENLILPADYQSVLLSASHRIPMFGSDDLLSAAGSAAATHEPEVTHSNMAPEIYRQDVSAAIKAKIASHPRYPRLLGAYIDCQKVGAPPEIVGWLDEIRRENDLRERDTVSTCYGSADPELDEFMDTYCEMLTKYKSDLCRPFDESTTFLSKMEMQLSNLTTGTSISTVSVSSYGYVADESDDASLDEDPSAGEVDNQDSLNTSEDRALKDTLLRKFGSHIGTLKLEFTKKKKKGKLPKEARQTLLEWWNLHCKWPYPTEADKIALAKATGLDQKQINNWFINQRKRHWKPSENMQFSVTEDIAGRFYPDE